MRLRWDSHRLGVLIGIWRMNQPSTSFFIRIFFLLRVVIVLFCFNFVFVLCVCVCVCVCLWGSMDPSSKSRPDRAIWLIRSGARTTLSPKTINTSEDNNTTTTNNNSNNSNNSSKKGRKKERKKERKKTLRNWKSQPWKRATKQAKSRRLFLTKNSLSSLPPSRPPSLPPLLPSLPPSPSWHLKERKSLQQVVSKKKENEEEEEEEEEERWRRSDVKIRGRIPSICHWCWTSVLHRQNGGGGGGGGGGGSVARWRPWLWCHAPVPFRGQIATCPDADRSHPPNGNAGRIQSTKRQRRTDSIH